MKGKLIKTDVNYILEDDKGVVIASTSLKRVEGLSLSLKNCQAIEGGYNLDELAMGYDLYENINFVGQMRAYKAGFQKALELMGDKIFTLDDMYTVFIMGREGMEDKMNRYVTRIHEPIEWDVEIEMICPHPEDTYVCGIQYGCDEDGCNHPNKIPLLDADGCLILKGISK